MKQCKYFKGDRPCKYYWIDKSWNCTTCKHHTTFKERILLIKLDALGDVVRSTALVQGIKNKYPDSQLTWLVKQDAKFFINNNPYVDRCLIYNEESIRTLQCEKFDILINLDKDSKATSMATLFNSDIKRGYGLNPEGHVIPFNKSAEYHYNICLDNYGGKADNKKSYQELIYDISEIDYNGQRPALFLDQKQCIDFKKEFFKQYGIQDNDKIILLNTGCGPVYPHKKWTYSGYKKLINYLYKHKYYIILAGSENEYERNISLYNEYPEVSNLINTTADYTIEQFCYLINLSNIIVTGDTVALHIAISLNKNIISFFGPTPSQEVDLFGLGRKFVSTELDCLNCYNQFPCPIAGKCMSLIKPEEVYESILDYI